MEKERARNSWRVNCEHLAERDSIITAYEEETAALKRQLSNLQARDATCSEDISRLSAIPSPTEPARHTDTASSPYGGTPGRDPLRSVPDSDLARSDVDPPATTLLRNPITISSSQPGGDPSSTSPPIPDAPPMDPPDGRWHQGRTPPIEFFTGEDPSILLDDWLPCLERAATWNEWTVEDKLMQLPGYLKGRALQEWHLLPRSEQQSYPVAVQALRARLDPGSKRVAAQEFCHSLQRSGETVSDFIRLLEKKYQIAYGLDDLNAATRNALLYGQLYEGLREEIMLSPSVSGAQGYKELATVAKGEERRLAALKHRRRYSKPPGGSKSDPHQIVQLASLHLDLQGRTPL